MSGTTRVLMKPEHPRTQDAVEPYIGEFDSTYFHGMDDSSMTRILRETEPKAHFPDRDGGPPVTKPFFEAVAGAIIDVSQAVSQAAQSVAGAITSGGSRYNSGSRHSDYYVR